jgi:hypothetical protein
VPLTSKIIECGSHGIPLEEIEKAYIAGIIDGEGSICLIRSNSRSSEAYIYPSVRIANTSTKLINWLSDTIGFGSTHYQDIFPGRKDVYHWGTASNEAVALLENIRPYLVIKKEQAEVALALWAENEAALQYYNCNSWGNYHPVPRYLRHFREACFLHMQNLNQRGVGPIRHTEEIAYHLANETEFCPVVDHA